MAIDISDNNNYYRWDIGSTGNLQLDYQNGGNNNMVTKLSIANDGSITSNALVKTSNSQDTTDPVFVMTDPNGKLVRGYSNYTSMNNSITDLQTKINTANASIAQLIEVSNTIKNQTSGALSVINSYIQKNLDTQVASLTTSLSTQQSTIASLQNSIDRIGNLTGTTGIRSNENLFNYIMGLGVLVLIALLVSILKKKK